MKIHALVSVISLANLGASALDFEGLQQKAIGVDVAASTGLQKVFVLPSTAGVTMVYTARSAQSDVHWYRFSNLGGAYGEELTTTRAGSKVSVAASAGDMGYIIEEGTDRYCYWLTDYSAHALELRSLNISPEQDCGRAALDFAGNASEIPYYTINGRRMVLSRDLKVEYNTLEFDDESFAFTPKAVEETVGEIGTTLHVTAPLCDTRFVLSGDRFLEAWGRPQEIESESFAAIAVDARTKATQTERESDNEQAEGGAEGLGGSAPCEITFEASVSDAAIFTEWQISRDTEFSIIENSFNDLSLTYTFTDQGNTYVRFVANNAAGTCEYVSDTYQVFIGESKLEIPNAFSPEASPGVNDEWKVSYKSLISYECHIFNRWGTQLFSSTNPAEGWDGKHGGKYVPAGVYFYVIKARGADGVNYEKAGDINIIKYKGGNTTGTGSEEGGDTTE